MKLPPMLPRAAEIIEVLERTPLPVAVNFWKVRYAEDAEGETNVFATAVWEVEDAIIDLTLAIRQILREAIQAIPKLEDLWVVTTFQLVAEQAHLEKMYGE